MNRIFIFLLLLLGYNTCIAQNDSAAKANQIIALEQRLANALPGDSTTWNKYLDKNWYVTTEDGSGQFRTAFLAEFYVFPKGVSGDIQVTKPIVLFHDNFAVIHYVADEHENYYGNKLHTTYGTVDTWYKTDTSWMMLSMLSFEIPALPPAVKVSKKILQKYTGVYWMNPENKVTVTLENDTLLYQKNKRPKEVLMAETATVFFRKTDSRGRKIFILMETGQMQMLERRNGQDVIWTRKNN